MKKRKRSICFPSPFKARENRCLLYRIYRIEKIEDIFLFDVLFEEKFSIFFDFFEVSGKSHSAKKGEVS